MPYTKQDFLRDVTKDHLDLLTPDELLAAMSPEKLRMVISKAEQRLAQSPDNKPQQPKLRAKSSRVTKRGSH